MRRWEGRHRGVVADDADQARDARFISQLYGGARGDGEEGKRDDRGDWKSHNANGRGREQSVRWRRVGKSWTAMGVFEAKLPQNDSVVEAKNHQRDDLGDRPLSAANPFGACSTCIETRSSKQRLFLWCSRPEAPENSLISYTYDLASFVMAELVLFSFFHVTPMNVHLLAPTVAVVGLGFEDKVIHRDCQRSRGSHASECLPNVKMFESQEDEEEYSYRESMCRLTEIGNRKFKPIALSLMEVGLV